VTDHLPLHVAVAVVVDTNGRLLIAQRFADTHQGGLWEFPGGKVEPGEDAVQALRRELREEVGIDIERLRPLIKVRHAYPDREVLLDVWRVERWRGNPKGCEGQRIAWVDPDGLFAEDFPAADRPIISAIRLPSLYLISPEPDPDLSLFLKRLEACIEAGVRLFQLRAKQMPKQRLKGLVQKALEICKAHRAYLLMNAAPAHAADWGADGVHLSSRRLFECSERPLGREYWVAASCHSDREVEQAMRIGVDFVAISPVYETRSHPAAPSLGWHGFAGLVERSKAPAYALGGVKPHHLRLAWHYGGQGLAMISGIWDAADPAEAMRCMLTPYFPSPSPPPTIGRGMLFSLPPREGRFLF
jgi:8-oxo-dGTP diphosphatase